jgi:hypothetical protein
MRASYSNLMQSKYFSPAFNSAIFDGPLRIYFAQSHESMALKIYFLAQQKLAGELALAKEASKIAQANILVMIYPDEESFEASFSEFSSEQKIVVEAWNEDVVIGLRRPLEDNELDELISTLGTAMRSWSPQKISSVSTIEL